MIKETSGRDYRMQIAGGRGESRSLRYILFVAICSCVAAGIPADALAHAPHDEVRAILLSPAYAQDGTVFAIIRYVILRSTDFGYTWRRLTRGLGPYSFLDLAVSPAFAVDGTLFAASADGGVFTSNDAGLTWRAMNHGLANDRIESLAISREYPQAPRLLALGSAGLHLWTGPHQHWRRVLDASCEVTSAAFVESSIIAGTRTGQLRVSDDNGRTWREVATLSESLPITCLEPLKPFSAQAAIAAGTTNGCVILSGMGGDYSVRAMGIHGQHITSLAAVRNGHGKTVLFASTWNEAAFRSDDLGSTWTKHVRGLTTDSQADDSAYRRPHFRGIAISSAYSRDKTVFLGGFDGLFKSTDRGESWRELSAAFSIGLIVGLDLAAVDDFEAGIAIATYVAGVYTKRPRGAWETCNSGIEGGGGRLFDIAFSPDYRSDRTVFTVGNWALFKSTDEGRRWRKASLARSRGAISGVRSLLASLIRRGVGFHLTRLGDRLKLPSWVNRGRAGVRGQLPGYGGTLAISSSFKADRTLFVGGALGVLRSNDGGDSLHYVLGPGVGRVRSIVLSPAFRRDGTVFVAFDGSIRRSTDAGVTWEESLTGPETSSARMAISPGYEEDGTIFLGGATGILRSRDRGRNWEPLTIKDRAANCPVDGLAISPYYPIDGELLVHVCGIGLFHSKDGGNSFASMPISGISPSPALSHMTRFPDRASLIKFSPHYSADRTIYASSMEDLLRSKDAGSTWETIGRPVRFEDSRREVHYCGQWRLRRDRRFSAVNARCSSQPGDVAHMDFVGCSVRWIGMLGPSQGVAKVMIDSELATVVDQYAEEPAYCALSFDSHDLTYGIHTISVEVTADKNARSSGREIIIDAFDVL